MIRLLLAVVLFATATTANAQPTIGSKAPDFALPDAAGKNISLSSLKGKVVLLDFWASWCRPCRVSNRQLQPVYDKYKGKGFEVLGVSVDERKTAWTNAVRQDKIEWLQVIDPMAVRGSRILQVWNVRFIPSTFLLDTKGTVLAVNPQKEELEAWLQKLL